MVRTILLLFIQHLEGETWVNTVEILKYTLVWPNQIYINESAKVFILAFFLRQELKEPQCPSFNFGTKFSIFIFINHIFKLFSQNSLRSLTLGVTNSHEYMKYMEYDELSWEWGFVTYLSYLSICEKSFKYSLGRSLSSTNFLSLKNTSMYTSSSLLNAGLAREFWILKSQSFFELLIFIYHVQCL